MSVFDVQNRVDHTSVASFLDPTGGPTIQRYDTLKYKQFDQLTDKQLGSFGVLKKWIFTKTQKTLKHSLIMSSISLPQT